jgi:RNA polymerase sigma factor (sigma-70 family)
MVTSRSHDPDRSAATELLCLACQGGDRAAWGELVDTWERPLFYYVRRLGASEADALQILQDTWIEVLNSLGSLKDPSRFVPWLYTITRRMAIRARPRRIDELTTHADISGQADPDDDFEARLDDTAAVHWGLERLPPQQREVLVLFFLRDLSLKDIAEVIDVPVGTVKSRLHKARQQLAALLRRSEAKP